MRFDALDKLLFFGQPCVMTEVRPLLYREFNPSLDAHVQLIAKLCQIFHTVAPKVSGVWKYAMYFTGCIKRRKIRSASCRPRGKAATLLSRNSIDQKPYEFMIRK